MSNINKIIGGIAVIALILSALAFHNSGKTVVEQVQQAAQNFGATFSTNAPAGNTVLGNGTVLPNPSTYDYLVARAYMFAGLFATDNGTSVPTNQDAARASIAASSTVLCSLTNPLGATSSVTHASIFFTTAPTSTLSLVVGTTTTNTLFATSSGMVTYTVLVSATGTAFTWDPGVSNDVIGPNGTITFGVGGGSANAGIYAPGGSCSALFVSDN